MENQRPQGFSFRQSRRPIAAILFATAVVPLPGFSQAQPQDVPMQRHEVTVTLKLVRVFVTDAAGRPAMNLRAEDFRILDNGVPQKITAFEIYVDASESEREPDIRLEKEVSPAAPERTMVPAKPAAQKFIFVIDTTNNDMQGLSIARRAAVKFLEEKLRPGDEAAVLTMSGRTGIKLVEELTQDLTRVRAAFDRVQSVPGRRWVADVEIGIRPLLGGKAPEEIAAGREYASMNPSGVYFELLPLLARAYAGVEGTKNLILFSSGVPGRSRGALAGRLLGASSMPVYAVNTQIAKNAVQIIPVQGDNAEDTEPTGQSTLEQVALLSGGRSFGSMNAILRFDRIAEDIEAAVRNYYVLGYNVRTEWDGRYHRVQVEVLKPGFTAHAQSGYFDAKPPRESTGKEQNKRLLD
ncbi:MAG: VWA domain-containing protein [Candidatus Aminicenantes bacterium]|nr:VWA domain-containing protein [Candidatus Aminicenantes bacterium]